MKLRMRLAFCLLVAMFAVGEAPTFATGQLLDSARDRHPISGRIYAQTMDVSGAAWLDRNNREDEEAPEKALKIIGIAPGSVVADVGAGSGYFTLKMASLVGPKGTVYATDIQPGMLDIIRDKLKGTPVNNVRLVLGAPNDPKLPDATLDLVLMVDVYHEIHEPQAVLRHLRNALKPGGRLVLLEYRAEDPNVPIRADHKMSVATAKLEVEAEGFKLASVNEDLPWQHVLTFTKN
jgi:ubiquinone/menaquinone biosynthesis C-methylase UbiE